MYKIFILFLLLVSISFPQAGEDLSVDEISNLPVKAVFECSPISSDVGIQTNEKIAKPDYVPDAETAIKIAEAIWLPIYGDKIYSNKPFTAKLVNGKVWKVEGTFPYSSRTKGGVPYIEIRKSDCKILKVTQGK